MISSAEFQQTLQAGKIHQALAILVRDASKLDITTHLTENSVTDDQIEQTGYLRTTINLLTGEIYNEVSKDILASGNNYIKLQQLHHDRIVASDRIVRGYLSQLQAILASLPSTLAQPQQVESSQLNSHALLARLTQAALLVQEPITSLPSSQFADNLAAPDDDDLDLSIDPEGAIWEEWVEDEDFSIGAASTSEWAEHWVQRQRNPVEISTPHPHTTAELTTSSARWNKFAPECLNVDTAAQHRTTK
jgi:hypothetical protein